MKSLKLAAFLLTMLAAPALAGAPQGATLTRTDVEAFSDGIMPRPWPRVTLPARPDRARRAGDDLVRLCAQPADRWPEILSRVSRRHG